MVKMKKLIIISSVLAYLAIWFIAYAMAGNPNYGYLTYDANRNYYVYHDSLIPQHSFADTSITFNAYFFRYFGMTFKMANIEGLEDCVNVECYLDVTNDESDWYLLDSMTVHLRKADTNAVKADTSMLNNTRIPAYKAFRLRWCDPSDSQGNNDSLYVRYDIFMAE
jgi:hypothetical protein